MAELTDVALRFLRLYGPLALLLFTFLETSMIFPFLPSEVVVPAAAALLITDPASFVVFVAAATVGGTVGAFVPYYVFRDTRIGGDWVREYVHVSDERIERGQDWFRKWGRSSVLWGRFLPALRSVVSIPAALAKMTPIRFGAYTAAGTVGFYAAAGAVVYYGRQRSLFEAAYAFVVARPILGVGGTLALVAVGFLAWRLFAS